MRIQITLTSQEGKRIIAWGIRVHPVVRKAQRNGKILLKGGTTVSAISEELCGKPLKISGMITPKGTLTSKFQNEVPPPRNLIPCSRGNVSCKSHIRCLYKEGKRI